MRRVATLKVMALTLMPILLLTACTKTQSNSQTVITQADVSSVSVTRFELVRKSESLTVQKLSVQ